MQEKTKQMMSNVGEKAQGAKEKVMGQSTKESAQSGGPGVGEKVKGMAHGASEAVKGTFGMGQGQGPP